MSTVTAYAHLLTRTHRVWIRGKLWHTTRLICRIPVDDLIDTGAGEEESRATGLPENCRD